jgi:hypothetical protein
MDWHSLALATAGAIGVVVAVIHGMLTQKLMVRPVQSLLPGDKRIAAPIRILIPALLQFSTYNWLLGGFGLIAAAVWLGNEARLAVGLLVGSSYLFGALVNMWATRARHPGGLLYALAVVLIGFGLS